MITITEALALAKHHHQAGDLDQAAAIYRQVLQANPLQPDALHFLGMIAHQAGELQIAVDYMQRSIAVAPNTEGFYCNLGLVYQALGQFDQAIACYRQALRLRPDFSDAHNNLGNALANQGKLDEAVGCYQYALRLDPNCAEAHYNLANALRKQGLLDLAAAQYQDAIRCKQQYANAHHNLGSLYQEQGQLDQALAHYRYALQISPHHANALINLGSALLHLGELEQAVAHLQRALTLKPDSAQGYKDLGTALRRLGRLEEAAASYRRALRLKPDYAQVYHELGMVLADQDALNEAATCFQRAADLDPDFGEASVALGVLLSDQMGKTDESLACLQRAINHRPTDRLRLVRATRLPVIYQSKADVQHWRERLLQEIRKLHEMEFVRDLTVEPALPLFYLAYQGLNDRDLQPEVAHLFRAPLSGRDEGEGMRDEGKPRLRPPLSPFPHPSSFRIRVGLISSFFKDHTIGHLTRGLVAQLSREHFAVTVLSVARHNDEIAGFFKQHADHYLEVPREPQRARRLVADQNLDVLFYTDIGMDPITYTLAFSRLAPVQCATWGHPVTTGVDTVDYFISAEDLETAESDQHYTERLVRLQTLPIYYYRPELPQAFQDRQHFGLPADAHVYACPQSLFKFHPDFDEVLGGILRSDPGGTLVLIKSKRPYWDDLLRQRFAATLPDVMDRICFLPPQDRAGFINLLAISDVLLDPLHFGGGNTSYEGFAVGTPIVTLPSRFLRGRITFALYKQMGILDLVAHTPDEYVGLALKLGTDREYREQMRKKILAACGVLFENNAGVRDLETFLSSVRPR